jgi:hypothetical protein
MNVFYQSILEVLARFDHKSPPAVSIVNQVNTAQTTPSHHCNQLPLGIPTDLFQVKTAQSTPSHLSKIHFNIIHPLASWYF